MKLILHIGMGKTGTTALQGALSNSTELLAEQKTVYLGRWLGVDALPFSRMSSYSKLGRKDRAEQEILAETFHNELAKRADREGIDTFIVSNEGISGQALIPFVSRLRQLMDVEMIAYVREARPWLSSAFRQWALRHKSREGDIPTFAQFAPELMKRYGKLRRWAEAFDSSLSIRKYSSDDIILDFSNAAGINLTKTVRRKHSTSEDAELLLRAWFNSRFSGAVKVKHFNETVAKLGSVSRRDLDMLIDRFFNHFAIDEVLDAGREDLDYFFQNHGIDLDPDNSDHASHINQDRIRNRLLDMVIEIQIQNSIRITDLERRLESIEGKLSSK